ncbi:MAG: ATP-binding cassette domain-containing protein [Bacteroidales bacterium]|nr:ATP-binding cassette domain-containing protein [Bacteroidales bacterium]
MSISIQNITKRFGDQAALNHVSFVVNTGEIVGLIGPNGAGKSTLMKIICGLINPSSGEVRIKDKPVSSNSTVTRMNLGYLPENNPLYTDLYVKEYLLHVAGLYQLGSNSNRRVAEVIEQTGLAPEMHKKIGLLSKGYRQRVGLAQAIIHNPDMLILDEPTTGLDPNQIIEIRNLISELGKEKTVILSTHIMQEVEAICKRVVILNKGTKVADDLTANLGVYTNDATQTILIELNQDVDDAVFDEITYIKKTKKITTGKWLIETTIDHDIRKDLFNLAVRKDLVVLSLHREEKKLEDVFRELTS